MRLSPPFLRPFLTRVNASPLGLRLARGMFWNLSGTLISRFLALCASIFVSRMLGMQGFGELGIIQSTVGMLGVFAGFGLGVTATKFVAEYRNVNPEKAGRIMALSVLFAAITGVVMTLLLLLSAPWIATETLAAPELSSLLQISAGLLFLSALNGAQNGALAGFEDFRSIALVNLLGGVSSFPLMVGGVYLAGLPGAVWGLVASMGVNCILSFYALHKKARSTGVHFQYRGSLQEFSVIHSFSLPSALAGMMVGPVYWACNALLVNQPGGYEQLGMFNAANQWFAVMLFLPVVLAQVALPVLSEQMGQGNKKQSWRVTILSIKVSTLVVIPLLIVLSLGSPWLMALYGPGFGDGWPILIVVLVTAGLVTILTPMGQLLVAGNRLWAGFMMNLGWAALFLLLTLYMVDSGAFGLAIARLAAYMAHAIWTYLYVTRFMNISGLS